MIIQEFKFVKKWRGHGSVIVMAVFTTLYTLRLLPHLWCTKWLLRRPGNFESKKICLPFSYKLIHESTIFFFLFPSRYYFPSLCVNKSFLCAIFFFIVYLLLIHSIHSLKLPIQHFFFRIFNKVVLFRYHCSHSS